MGDIEPAKAQIVAWWIETEPEINATRPKDQLRRQVDRIAIHEALRVASEAELTLDDATLLTEFALDTAALTHPRFADHKNELRLQKTVPFEKT